MLCCDSVLLLLLLPTHTQAPYSPNYKLAPEWHPVLDMIQQHQQRYQPAAADSADHIQVHKRILAHGLVEHLQKTAAAQHLRHAAAAVAADAAISHELKHDAPHKVLIGVHFAEVPASALQRLGIKESGFHPAAAAAHDWAEPLSGVVTGAQRCAEHKRLCTPELIANSPSELDVAVCPQVCVCA